MENDLISRSTFRQQLIDRQITTNFFNPEKREEDGCIIDLLDKAPADDDAPVRHGRWIDGEDDYGSYVTCSICKDEFTNWEADCAYTNYCPSCGAKMDGGDDNGR